MTPPAATAAGRTLTRPVAPRAPRRVSGPAARPRRGADAPRTRRAPASTAADPFVLRALHRSRALADSRFLDRLIRGRLWIPIVAAGLMGIVFMQVSMLKLNAGIGRAVQSAATLERQNTNLRAAVSGMESGTRIDAAARQLGMVVPVDGSTHYVTAATRGLATAAAKRMTAADPEAIARSKAATALAAGQTTGAALTAAATGAAATQAATTAPATATAAPAATPTGTTATAPPAAATTAPVQTSAPAATTTPQPVTQQPTGATAAPATQTQAQPQAQTQQATSTPTVASTSGGAVAPPQG